METVCRGELAALFLPGELLFHLKFRFSVGFPVVEEEV